MLFSKSKIVDTVKPFSSMYLPGLFSSRATKHSNGKSHLSSNASFSALPAEENSCFTYVTTYSHVSKKSDRLSSECVDPNPNGSPTR